MEGLSFDLFRVRIPLASTRSLCVHSLQTHPLYSALIYKSFGSMLLELINTKKKFPLELSWLLLYVNKVDLDYLSLFLFSIELSQKYLFDKRKDVLFPFLS